MSLQSASRFSVNVQSPLDVLEKAVRGDKNTMPYILDAVENYATLGEIANVFRNVFGEYSM